jgi:hypothetical protein
MGARGRQEARGTRWEGMSRVLGSRGMGRRRRECLRGCPRGCRISISRGEDADGDTAVRVGLAKRRGGVREVEAGRDGMGRCAVRATFACCSRPGGYKQWGVWGG